MGQEATVRTLHRTDWFKIGKGEWQGCISTPCYLTSMLHSVQLLSHVWLWDPMECITPGFPVHHKHPELAPNHVHQVRGAIQPSHPLSSPAPPAFSLSQHKGLFQWVSSSHQVAKVLEFQLQHNSSSEFSGLISFRTDWFDLLVVQRTLKSLLQHHSSKASILQCD